MPTCSKQFQITIASSLQLKAYWKFDEASGDRADSQGTNTLRAGNYAGPVGGAGPGSEAGVINNAVLFTGVQSVGGTAGLTLASPSSELTFDPTKGVTLAFWYKQKITGGAVADTLHQMEFGGNTYLSPNGIYIAVHKLGLPNTMTVFGTGTNGNAQSISLGALSIDAFHLIIVWIDPADYKLRAQLDNGSIVVSSGSMNAPTAFPSCFVFLGKTTAPNGRNFDLDEMAIWRGLLDSTQRDYIWNSGSGRTIGPGYPGV